jgi:anaerobic selenocysteine-containing dehydrogenase
MSEHVFRTCNLCEAMCGLRLTVEGDKVTDVRGDEDDVLSRGHICPKGPAMRDLHEDPDRLRRPMRRVGQGFVPVSWDEALAETADRLHEIQVRHGKDAVGVYRGNPAGHNHGAILVGQALLAALGTKNSYDAGSQDANPRLYAALAMFGDIGALSVPDVDRTAFFLCLGANPAASNGSIMSLGDVRGRLAGIRERGGRFVLVDPRRTETAAYADEHHFIRPGGDAALLLAMLHVIFAEGLCDEAAVASIAAGLADVRRVAERFAPERVAAAVGIEATAIRALATGFARAKSAVAYGRMGICTGAFGPVASWLIEVLNIVTGNFDRPGGAMFAKPAVDLSFVARHAGVNHAGQNHTRVRGLPEIAGMLPATAMAEEIETPGEGQIRAMVTLAGNPVLSVPGGERLARALGKLEFMVSIDLYLNETTRHAHLVLPPRSALERGHYDVLFHALAVRNTAKWSEPSLPPAPDSREDGEILYDLALRIAAKRGGPLAERAARLLLAAGAPSPERLVDLLLRAGPYPLTLAKLKRAPHGVDLGPLIPMRRERVRTPSGRIALAPAPLLADVDRVDGWLKSAQGGELLLIGRRHVRSNNSWMHNLRPLVKGPDRATLLMAPADAAARGLVGGARVRVKSRAGEVVARLEVTPDVMRGTVSLPHGFGHAPAAATMRVAGEVDGPNANDVTDELLLEPLTGTAILNGVSVSVEAADAPAAAAE